MPLLGCIADDFTGATDLAAMLVGNGMRTVLMLGRPKAATESPKADAVVVALKSRTTPAAQAVSDSLDALTWLRAAGARQIVFKYCSTFDSTAQGNIGPVADALAEALETDFALVCPAFPANGRTVYQGHLFVGDHLLNESGMRDHPLTPMRDASVVRLLAAQTPHRVGLIALPVVEAGVPAIDEALRALRATGVRYGVIDALTDDHLRTIGAAAAGHRLITGGSGVAMGLPENFRRQGLLPFRDDSASLPKVDGGAAVLVGSCSQATRQQVAQARPHLPTLILDPLATPEAGALMAIARAWIDAQPAGAPLMIVGSAAPEAVAALQKRLGAGPAGALIETVLAGLAEDLVERGIRSLVVAGARPRARWSRAWASPACALAPRSPQGCRGRWPIIPQARCALP